MEKVVKAKAGAILAGSPVKANLFVIGWIATLFALVGLLLSLGKCI